MKKKAFVSFLLLCLVLVSVFWNASLKSYYLPIWNMGCAILLPTLVFPIFLLEVFFQAGGFYHFLSWISSPKKKKIAYLFCLIFCGFLAGTPSLATMVHHGIEKGDLTKKEGTKILSFFLFPSFPYLYYLFLQKPSIAPMIIFPILFSCLGFLLCFRIEEVSMSSFLSEDKVSLTQVSRRVGVKLFDVLAGFLLFSFPGILFQQMSNELGKYLLQGLFEFSFPLYQLLQVERGVCVIGLLLSFSSCSIFYQTHCLCPEVSIRSIMVTRSCLTLFMVMFFFLL